MSLDYSQVFLYCKGESGFCFQLSGKTCGLLFFSHGLGRTQIVSLCKKNILDELLNLYEVCDAVNKGKYFAK